jgi:hypothetical protein
LLQGETKRSTREPSVRQDEMRPNRRDPLERIGYDGFREHANETPVPNAFAINRLKHWAARDAVEIIADRRQPQTRTSTQ